ncbi:MAG: RDD family protein [Nitrosospira sp.]|nr:RDD family protein [Nitrosospira sp.]MDW7643311.1 RDD family protein [Nitrosomonadaceae bacterium]MBI0407134.1 RDD family protein [Nitrosospira sp.]MBI0414103.1 RDD family protein [Nitrosospira sp.]MBI0416156.1 RDD family protein [Nitrosospira sp.]
MNHFKEIEISVPTLRRRLLSMVYELLLLIAVLFICSLIFHLIFRDTDSSLFKPVFQFYLLSITGIYFSWFWTHGGQTLAMQTWKLQIISIDGGEIGAKKAIYRYLFALISIFLLGCGILWALYDRDRQFMHDRLAGTRIINVKE